MFAAPKEIPSVTCCQALKKRKADNTATSAAQQIQSQQQVHQGACCHGVNVNSRAGDQPPAPAAACCSFSASQVPAMQQLTGPLQASIHAMAPQKVVETCAAGSMNQVLHALVPPTDVPAATSVTATGPEMVGCGMGIGHPGALGWAYMGPSAAAPSAAVMATVASSPGFFTDMTGGVNSLAGMGWAAQAMALQMPSFPLQPIPGAHMHCAPPLSMPAAAFPTPSGVFQQQYSMALPLSSVPSPALGSSGETNSLQASADNGKSLGMSGDRAAGGPTYSGGRQQADSSNMASMLHPNKAQQICAVIPGGGDLSDFVMSDSDGEDEVGRRGPAGGNRCHGAQQQQQQPFMGDIVALHDVGDDNGLMVCQVPGCGKDLTALKEYHQRYRICDVHIKLQQVGCGARLQPCWLRIIFGIEQALWPCFDFNSIAPIDVRIPCLGIRSVHT